MADDFNHFGLERKLTIPEKQIGRWVVLYSMSGSRNFSGKVADIEDGHYILNPHYGGIYDAEGNFRRELIDEDSPILISSIGAIEPTSEASLMGCVEAARKEIKRSESKQNQADKDSK